MLQKKLASSHYHIMYPLFLVLILLGGVLIVVNQTQNKQQLNSYAATTNCTVSSSQLTVKAQEQQLLDEINIYRGQNKVGQLTMNSVLKQSAAWQSSDMLAHNTLSHTDSLGRTPEVRLTECGYNIAYGYGESIAEGSPSAALVFDAWKADPTHNQIMLDPSYTITGIDVESNSAGTATYWTMDLGATSVPTPTQTTVTGTVTATQTPTVTGSSTPNPTTTASPSSAPSGSILSPTLGPVTADMLISVSVKINGIGSGGNVNPLHKTRKVTVYIYGVGTQPVTSGTGYLSYDGSNYFTGVIHLGKLNQGPYFVKIVSDNTLQVLVKPEFQNLLINKTNIIPPVTLYQGDMNGDNVIDLDDYNLVLPCFQSLPTCSNMSLDFNDDGVINILDYNLFLQSFETLHGD